MNPRILNPAMLAIVGMLLSCSISDPRGLDFDPEQAPTDQTVNFFNRFESFSVGPDQNYAYELVDLEARTQQVISSAHVSVRAAFENLNSVAVANALVQASQRGIDVRVVADIDRRGQDGFNLLEREGIEVIYGDGEILWQAVFGEDNVVRRGEDNRMMHNFVIADGLRMINMTRGFPPAEGPLAEVDPIQVGFIAHSEDLVKDYGDVFDQLHGGVFSTQLTFYDDTVSSDTNNRTFYPLQDGVIEAYFGPQEPLVKEIIDQIYAAKASVYIASNEFRNGEIARALRYKAEAGFDVRVVVAQPLNQREESGALIGWFEDIRARTGNEQFPIIRENPNIGHTMVFIDGRPGPYFRSHQPGRMMLTSMPIFEAAGYYVQSEMGGGSLVLSAQPAGLFTDTNMWVVHEARNNADGFDYLLFVQLFDRIFAEAN